MGGFSFGKKQVPVGLDIGTKSFRVAHLRPSSDKPVLTNYGSISVPVGAVIEGEVVDVEAVSQALSQLWKKLGMTNKHVVIGVANQKVVIRLVEMPFMDKAELKSALQYQAQDYIPIPIEEAILDFQVIGEYRTEAEERMLQILLVAAQKEMIEKNVQAVEGAGLKPQAIDVSSFAIVRSLLPRGQVTLPEEEAQSQPIAIINVAAGTTNIVVVEQLIPRFTRVSSIAGNSFTEAIVEHLGVPFDEADELKQRIGLPPLKGKRDEGIPAELADMVEPVQDILVQEMTRFTVEVRRSLDYYLAQTTQVSAIGRLVVSGMGAKLRYLTDYLQKELDIAVELGRPLQNVEPSSKVSKELLAEEELSMAICVGLALREFDK